MTDNNLNAIADLLAQFSLSVKQVQDKERANFSRLGALFTKHLDIVDEELSDFKKENNITEPIYKVYTCWINIFHPLYNKNGLMIDSKTPKEIVEKYESAFLKTLDEY